MLSPLPADRWQFASAAHLLVRAGFGGKPQEIEKLHSLGLARAVDSLVNVVPDQYPIPAWINPAEQEQVRLRIQAAILPEEKQAIRQVVNQQFRRDMGDLTRWWMARMVNTPAPLIEKMTLFWHGHFATSAEKVKPAYKMWLQNETFRQNALGNFGHLAKALSRDPAMMVWLDTIQSKKEHPNENFAREVMELFMLGEGHYTEQDVKEAARAFTGYRIDPVNQSFRFAPAQFDFAPKNFMGKTGPWNGDQVLNIILSQPQCARFISGKIWKFFAYDNPEPKLLDALAAELLNARYELKPLLKRMFRSEEFYSDKTRNSQVKSPIQFLVQTFRTLPVSLPDANVLESFFRQMGQVPFFPPNVKGWDGGKNWINTATLTFRYKLSRQLVAGISPQEIGLPKRPMQAIEAIAPRPTISKPLVVDQIASAEDRNQPNKLVDKLFVRVFQQSPQSDIAEKFNNLVSARELPLADDAIRDLIVLRMTTPNYQVC